MYVADTYNHRVRLVTSHQGSNAPSFAKLLLFLRAHVTRFQSLGPRPFTRLSMVELAEIAKIDIGLKPNPEREKSA